MSTRLCEDIGHIIDKTLTTIKREIQFIKEELKEEELKEKELMEEQIGEDYKRTENSLKYVLSESGCSIGTYQYILLLFL